MSKLQAALSLAADGFAVFPLAINGKNPAIDGNWRKVATTDPARINRLWRDPVFDTEIDFNIGIALDKNRIVVDVDTRDGKVGAKSLRLLEAINDELPATYEVITASGGRHLYFAVEDSSRFPKELATHIDLKGHGGYVVGPGSTIDGRPYEARGGRGERGVADAPQWLRDFANGKRLPDRDRVAAEPITELDTEPARRRAVEWLTTAAPDHGTFKVAARVKDFGLSEEECLEAMLEHWPGAEARDADHIAFRVGNAYRYGTSPAGIANPEAEFEAVDTSLSGGEVKRPPRGLYAIRFADAVPEIDRPYLIDDVMDLGTMAVTYGDSNVGKTYIVLDQALAVASGGEWNGHKTQAGLVVYVAAEGGRGFMKRLEAYKRDRKLAGLPFSVVPCPIDLHSQGDAGDTGRLIRLVRAEEAHFGVKCVLVVVDTLARAIGAGDENTATDMGLLVGHCDRLRAALGATVNVIHHTGKDAAKGARGSSALRAATDTEIEVIEGRVSVKKQRDMARADDMHFRLRAVDIGARADGRAVSACVVDWIAASEFAVTMTPAAEKMWAAFEDIEAELLDEAPDEKPMVPWDAWRDRAARTNKSIGASGRTYALNLRKEIVTSGLVHEPKRGRWCRV